MEGDKKLEPVTIPNHKALTHIVKRKKLCKSFAQQAIMYGIDVLDMGPEAAEQGMRSPLASFKY